MIPSDDPLPTAARTHALPQERVRPRIDDSDEPAFYSPPARSYVPPQRMLLALLAALSMLVLVVAGGAIYLTRALDQTSGPTLTDTQLRQGASAPAVANLPPPPPVHDVVYLDVPREEARLLNEAVPFSSDPIPAATPFRLKLLPVDDARAVDCLAAAVWYEAGDDALGQQSVAQTVINRVRHPSFPNTVCGVVFQGAERETGCQFSFTCDGSMIRRRPSPAAWGRAQSVANASLHGFVFTSTGWATHYHTDWVVPNWSRSVDKIARVRTHLFFRWLGGSGRPPAFRQAHAGSEPGVAQMRALSPAHAELASSSEIGLNPDDMAPPPDAASLGMAPPSPPADLRGNAVVGGNAPSGLYVVRIAPGAFSGNLALMALDMCKSRQDACTVVGYTGEPGRVTGGEFGRVRWSRMPEFYYFSDKSRSRENVFWNCDVFARSNKSQCLSADFVPLG